MNSVIDEPVIDPADGFDAQAHRLMTAAGEDSIEPPILDPKEPMVIARDFRQAEYAHEDHSKLVHTGDAFWNWDNTKWTETSPAEIRSKQYKRLEKAKRWTSNGHELALEWFRPTKSIVDNAIDALKAECYTKAESPCWMIDRPNLPNPREVVAAKNCLVHLKPDGDPVILGKPTPAFFSQHALDYEVHHRAPKPKYWLDFLAALWPDDTQSIGLLQEWFGYVLTLDTRQQKILLLIGPPRSGKGTIARILTAMIGAANVCGPTLSGIASQFGLWSLIAKQLAIISDARLSGRTDLAAVVERLLAISGEDAITIDRKNLVPLTIRLLIRFMIISNELPRLADSSGALANRFLVLTLNQSFLGNEDTQLGDRLLTELPGILLWAIEGWQRLRRRGHFVQPDASEQAIEEMKDLASPIAAFIRDWCDTGPALTVATKDLFAAWGLWCHEQGRDQAGTLQVFGRDLRAAMPAIRMVQTNSCGIRGRVYSGLSLTTAATATLANCRMAGGKP
jgi:putative DNA primase/helicase